MIKFIILTYGRTGSTYISQWLNKHYEIVCLGEILRETEFKDTIIQYFKDQGNNILAKIFAFIIRYPKIGFLFSLFLLGSIKRYFNFVFSDYHIRRPDKKASHPNYSFKAQGFKLPYRQLYLFWGLKKHITKIKIIHLLRKNVLAIFISKLAGIKYDIYHSREKIQIPKIRVPIRNLRWKLKFIKYQQKYFAFMIRKTNHITIYYEDFFSIERDKIEKEILTFLNVTSIDVSYPKIVKLSGNQIKDRVYNYEEIVARLKGTQFDYCLD